MNLNYNSFCFILFIYFAFIYLFIYLFTIFIYLLLFYLFYLFIYLFIYIRSEITRPTPVWRGDPLLRDSHGRIRSTSGLHRRPDTVTVTTGNAQAAP